MNTTTLNMTTLDGGNVIIKRGEGGGSMPPSGGSNVEYYDVSGLNAILAIVLAGVSVNVKWDSLGSVDHHPIVIAPMGMIGLPRKEDGYTPDANILAVAVDKTIVMYDRLFGETPISVGDFIEGADIDLASIPRITKEEFYSLE
jgi:hypothetical protein